MRPQKQFASQLLRIQFATVTYYARSYQEDLRTRPGPLPLAGGQARAEDQAKG